MIAVALSSCRPALVAHHRRPAPARPQRRAPATRAFLQPMEIVTLAADAAPGTVDAPIWAIVVGAVVVTAASFAVSAGLKSGVDESIKMQARDAKKFNKYDK